MAEKTNSGHMGHELGRSFSIIYRHGKMMRARAMKEFQLSGSQMSYLRLIHMRPGISQEEIAREEKMDKGAVAKAIRDMTEKGYVIRKQNGEDKRAYRLYPAAKSEEICLKAKKHADMVDKKLMAGMTEEEIKTFGILLAKITKNIEDIIKGDEK